MKEENKELSEKEKLMENLKDKTFVDYNLLVKLEEIKQIELATHQLLSDFIVTIVSKWENERNKDKEKRESVLR